MMETIIASQGNKPGAVTDALRVKGQKSVEWKHKEPKGREANNVRKIIAEGIAELEEARASACKKPYKRRKHHRRPHMKKTNVALVRRGEIFRVRTNGRTSREQIAC